MIDFSYPLRNAKLSERLSLLKIKPKPLKSFQGHLGVTENVRPIGTKLTSLASSGKSLSN